MNALTAKTSLICRKRWWRGSALDNCMPKLTLGSLWIVTAPLMQSQALKEMRTIIGLGAIVEMTLLRL